MIRIVIFWLSFPFVLGQALRLKKKAPRASGASGPKEGTAGRGHRFNLIAIGDSIISGVGASILAHALVGRTAQKLSEVLRCKINWTAFGNIGAGSDKILNQLIPELPDTRTDFFVLSVGVNDVTGLTSVSKWERNLDAILRAITKHSPDAIVAVAGIPPLERFPLLPQPLRAVFGLRGRTFDMTCQRVVSMHPSAIHVPLGFEPQPDHFSPDGFHPSEAGYQELGQLTAEMIAEKFKARATKIA